MTQARHLVTVWNPSYADDALDAHLRVLLRSAAGQGGEEEPYVWWAKVRSPNRQQPMPYADDILAIQDQIDEGVETHLYLTDYRSLCVTEVDEITADRIRSDSPGRA